MFTGLVTAVGTVHAFEPTTDGARLTVIGTLPEHTALGDSIAVDGVCVTLTAIHPPQPGTPSSQSRFTVDLIAPTLGRTTLGVRRRGDRVNLEPALLAGDRLGGHFLTGHVDGVGEVLAPGATNGGTLRLSLTRELGRYLVPQGSVAVAGVSLTVAELADEVDRTIVTIGIIPTTAADTTLGALAAGDRVNVEVDLLAKHVDRLLQHRCTAPTHQEANHA